VRRAAAGQLFGLDRQKVGDGKHMIGLSGES
jgi:hypothetical protein